MNKYKLCGCKESCFEPGERWGHLGGVLCKHLGNETSENVCAKDWYDSLLVYITEKDRNDKLWLKHSLDMLEEERNGPLLIQSIRAGVIKYSTKSKNGVGSFENYFNKIESAIYNGCETTPVGYLMARYDEKLKDVVIAYSFCAPEDYLTFTKAKGKTIAYRKLLEGRKVIRLSQYHPESTWIGKSSWAWKDALMTSFVSYAFNDSLYHILGNFVARCNVYFKDKFNRE